MFKGQKDFVAVDMTDRMRDLGLLGVIPLEAWPQPNAVRELATRLKKLKAMGIANPFVSVDLHK